MAFDKITRNRLQKFVSESRGILTEEFTRQLQATYGMDPKSGTIAAIETLAFLDNKDRQTATILRETLAHFISAIPTKSEKEGTKQALDRIIREQAFTVLNRLVALRMAEARGFLIESIAKGYSSKGFQLYKNLAGTALGDTGDAYRCYLFSIFDEFSLDLAVLFDRHSSQGRLFPREPALLALLEQVNHFEIEPLWAEDETIGWVYQYFNSQEERKKMRAESQAPRNSRELAVRNQFFTPRYVVEFLTDNTLGRIWYEMTQGKTALIDCCSYLVRRPTEIFLAKEEVAPVESDDKNTNLSQEELIKQPVYIPYRAPKDPRELLMLDPACGSMHFGLYAFDLYEKIYEEAWQLETELGPDAFERLTELQPLQSSYKNFAEFHKAIPKLIIEKNIHGVDIDPRAVQMAGLSLWQRGQRAWHQMGIKPGERPAIKKSNIVCAEPMPGEREMLKEFTAKLNPPVLGQLVETIFEKMELAGEAGTLLKIEEDLKNEIARARKDWNVQSGMLFTSAQLGNSSDISNFNLSGINDESFWDSAEERILKSLSEYADQAELDNEQKRLFAEDAAKGFAFIDLCRKRFDVVLMNPPFGLVPASHKPFFKLNYPEDWTEIYACFIARMLDIVSDNAGYLGAITSSLWLYTKHQHNLRLRLCSSSQLDSFIDLGGGVLDGATVDTGLLVVAAGQCSRNYVTMYQDFHGIAMNDSDQQIVQNRWIAIPIHLFSQLPMTPFCFHVDFSRIYLWSQNNHLEPSTAKVVTGNSTFDNFRFLRLHFEVSADSKEMGWIPYDKGGHFQPFFNPTPLLWNFENDAAENCSFQISKYGTDAQVRQSISFWFKSGICYSRATSIGFSPRILPANSVMNEKSITIFPHFKKNVLPLLAILASTHVQDLLDVFGRHRNIENRAVSGLPIDSGIVSSAGTVFEKIALHGIDLLWKLESMLETSPVFVRPPSIGESASIMRELTDLYKDLDRETAILLYGKQVKTVSALRSELVHLHLGRRFDWESGSKLEYAWVSYIIGVAFGRWTAALSNDSIARPSKDEILNPLPWFQPAQRRCLNTGVKVLVDDPGDSFDIIEAYEQAIKQITAYSEDGAFLFIPDVEIATRFIRGNFFDYHLALYNISARYAPIYWPLQTLSGSYTLWIYYHSLTEQTLYTCVNDFVDPKLRTITYDLNSLRNNISRSKTEEKELAKLSDLEVELKDFRDELLRIAGFWKPNLNDGVQITAAPLWKLFQHKKWQKKLKETWDKLEKGDYDWAHLACSIWPERVLLKCHEDRSLAIAHDVESDFWEEVEIPVIRRGKDTGKTKIVWHSKMLSDLQLKEIIRIKIEECRL